MKPFLFLLKTIVFSFFFLINLYCQSQYHFTRNITINDGLPSNSIQAIFKDSRGYFWIGTEAGLCRFEGTSFKIYTQQDGLPGNRIWSIAEDTSGNLWLACYGNGISKFDGKTFRNYSSKDGLINDNVRKVQYSEKHKGLLIGTEFGFSFFKDSTFTSFQDKSITDRDLLQVTDFLDCDTMIYIFTYYDSQQFIEFNPLKKEFRYLPKDHRYHFHSNKTTCSYITSKKDTIIGDLVHGVKIYTKDSIIINDNIGQVFDITEDDNTNLWIASWNDGNIGNNTARGGIYRLTNYISEYFGDYLGINSQKCWCLYFDKNENVLWIGTLDNGLYQYPITGFGFTPASDLNPGKPLLRDIFSDSKNRLWISVGDRIIVKDTLTQTFTSNMFQQRYDRFLKTNIVVKDPVEYKKLVNAKISDFYRFTEDIPGRLLVNSNAGLYNLNSDSVSLIRFGLGEGISYFIENGSIFSILTQYDMSRFTLSDFKLIDNFRLRKTATYSSFCNYIKDNDIYWIYNNTDGLFKYQRGEIKKYEYLRKDIDLSFTTLTKDFKGNLIAGTNSGNLYFLKIADDSVEIAGRLTQKDGISGNDIRWALADKNNRLWFATNKGLNMIDLEKFYGSSSKEISFFNEENGFFDRQTTKAILESSGRILIMSEANLLELDPDRLIKSLEKVNLLKIDNIDVNFSGLEQSFLSGVKNWTDIPETGLKLPFNKNNLTFYFHLLQYCEPGKSQYSYKLDRYQNDWTPFTQENKAVFTNLSENRYKLRIRGRLQSSPEKITEIEYSFEILPPWYRTWWFYGLAFITIFSLSLLFIRNRIKVIRSNAETERKISDLKMEALKAQMNPHFIFNAFNSIQKFILQKDTKAALDYMSEFALLIRQTLDNSTKSLITLSDEIKYLSSYIDLEKRRILNLTYRIEIDSDVDPDEIFFPPMLLQPFVENSILHGIRHMEKEGIIVVRFNIINNGSTLISSVEDNGVGRNRAKEINEIRSKTHKSHGTRNTFQRMELLGIKAETIDLFDEKGKPAGTKVELEIKV